MLRSLTFAIRLCSPVRSYRVFIFLVTLFLLFKRRQRILLWRPLPPQELIDTIQTLGASFLKLAQVLATRADFFEQDYLAALRQLHDRMPAMTADQQQRVFARAFADATIFASFDHTPIASASIGQVHRARLARNGEEVAVKLLREDMQTQVRIDIILLKLFLCLFRPLFSNQTRHSLESVLRAFAQVIVQEVSMQHELANLEQFSQTYASSGVRFPRPYKEHSSDFALVMSFEHGVRIDSDEAQSRLEGGFEEIMQKLVLFYVDQMLVRGYFHADPHPGNLLISPEGELILVDFGMVSRIPKGMRQSMILAVKSAYERDFDALVNAIRKMGVLSEDVDVSQLSHITEGLFDIFDSEKLDSRTMQDLAFGVLSVLRDQPFKLPQDIIYVMRVSSLIEGLGTQSVENYNGIKDILPIIWNNLPKALDESVPSLERLAQELLRLPVTISTARRVFEQADQGDLVVRMSPTDRSYLISALQRQIRTLGGLIFWIALAFYLQAYATWWATLSSIGCFAAAGVTLVLRSRETR